MEDRYIHNFMKWYWIKWILMLSFKLIITITFVICGPIMAVQQVRGLTSYDAYGIFICCVFSCILIPDLYFTLLVPWFGARSMDWPVWMEDWKSLNKARDDEIWYLEYLKRRT